MYPWAAPFDGQIRTIVLGLQNDNENLHAVTVALREQSRS